MLMMPGDMDRCVVSKEMRASHIRRQTMRVITKQIRSICREIALLKIAQNCIQVDANALLAF